jgi:hypothetical protein
MTLTGTLYKLARPANDLDSLKRQKQSSYD